MHRTHTTRPAGGALVVVIATMLSLLFGALGVAAQADDTTTTPAASPSADPSSTSDPQSSDSTTTAPADPETTTTTPDPVPPLTASPDTLVLRRGLTGSVNVATNDTCPAVLGASCTYTLGVVPTGWTARVSPAGIMTITVPAATTPRMYRVYYRFARSDNPAATVESYANVGVTPDNYGAPAGMLFSHPFRPNFRDRIRTQILRTINSVPPGARINIASWSFASRAYSRALNQAKARGVTVQVVVAARNLAGNSDYSTLVNMLGTRVTPSGNWVKRCYYSCRGRSGTMHSKIFLFSQVYRTPYVTMTGSANLTDFAATGQWNQMDTTKGKAVYDGALKILIQMAADRPASPMYAEYHYPSMWSYFYPRGAVTPTNDFMLKALAPVRCSGAVNAGRGGHTIIKIAMYAWYQDRGMWLAKRVRQLWQRGCQIQIVYAISSNPVKKILYSPAGRGRIPMRQILLTNRRHVPIYYLHDKWVAITGNYAGVPNNSVSFQGSFNFSNLGFSSDENFERLSGRPTYDRFARDFTLLWTDRQARAPSPVSMITNVERTAPAQPTLGTGTYQYMEAD